MDNFEFDFNRMARKADVEFAKRVFTKWVGIVMCQLFILCICSLIVLFWTNKLTLFLLSLMGLFFVVILLAVYTTNKSYRNKLKAMEDEE